MEKENQNKKSSLERQNDILEIAHKLSRSKWFNILFWLIAFTIGYIITRVIQ